MDQEPNITQPSQIQPVDMPPPNVPIKPQIQKKSHKKALLLILFMIIIGAASAWYFVIRKSPTTNTPSTAVTPSTTPAVLVESLPDKVAYAYSPNSSTPISLYWRLTSVGNRNTASTFVKNDTVLDSAINGQKVAVLATKGKSQIILYSSDSGVTYKTIFTGKASTATAGGDQITSLVFSSDGNSLIIGLLKDPASGNEISRISLNSGNQLTKLFTSQNAGIFLYGYSSTTKKAYYQKGCYNCDGPPSGKIYVTDTSSNQTSSLIDVGTLPVISFSADYSTMMLAKSTTDTGISAGPGYYIGPPYSVQKVNVSNGSKTDVATIGTKSSFDANFQIKNDNSVGVGYMADGKTPYYFADKQLFTLLSAKPSLLFEASGPILGAYFVSTDNVITTVGKSADYNMFNYSTKTKKVAKILGGDNNVTLFGVTTK